MYSTKLKRYTLPTGRKVVEPNPELKQFLKKLNIKAVALYEQLLNEHNLENIPQAYRKNHSVKTNAQIHKNQKIIHKFDFSGFYDSIPFVKIKPYLKQINAPLVKQYYIDPKTNGLIQGSPISGTLAGLALIDFWKQLKKELPDAIITQYSDDLTISKTKLNQHQCQNIIKKCLKQTNTPCKLNNKKTTTHKVHRKITGVTVNHKNQVTTNRDFYRKLRTICNSLKYNKHSISDYGYRDLEHFKQVLSYHIFIDDTGKIQKLLNKYGLFN